VGGGGEGAGTLRETGPNAMPGGRISLISGGDIKGLIGGKGGKRVKSGEFEERRKRISTGSGKGDVPE